MESKERAGALSLRGAGELFLAGLSRWPAAFGALKAVAFCEYERTHTHTHSWLRGAGRGVGGVLSHALVQDAELRGSKAGPPCDAGLLTTPGS